jgi:hypothetical protein
LLKSTASKPKYNLKLILLTEKKLKKKVRTAGSAA